MNNTLVIYDTTGYILQQMNGNVREPVGVPFLWIEIPEGQYVSSVDVNSEIPVPVFKKYGSFDYENATLEEVKAHQIELSKLTLENYLSSNTITSICHGSTEKQYTITKEKQTLLTQMILITQMAAQSNITYQSSWNAAGEACTYDWTLEELKQLAFEIEIIVRPLVSQQQTMEAKITAATTKDEILAVDITF